MRKSALITGASRGIGAAIAKRLAEMGYDLVLTARDVDKLRSVQQACEKWGHAIEIMPADLACESAVLELFANRSALDLLVNNAGFGVFDKLVDFELADLQSIFRVNVEGAFLCLREAMRLMKKQGGGRIINIASVVGVKGYPEQGPYGASKHALVGLTKAAIEEGREHNIHVHAICPGAVATDMVKESRPDLSDFSAMLQPDDVANAVAYLCSLPKALTVDVIHLRRFASAQSW